MTSGSDEIVRHPAADDAKKKASRPRRYRGHDVCDGRSSPPGHTDDRWQASPARCTRLIACLDLRTWNSKAGVSPKPFGPRGSTGRANPAVMRIRSDGPCDYHLEPAQSPDRDPGRVRPDRIRHLLGGESERRGLSRPDSAPGRGDHPEPRRQPRGDGAPDRHPARDRLERDAGAGIPAQHVGCRADRHQVPVRLRDRLLGVSTGGHQPHRLLSTCPKGSPPGSRPGARPARSSATSWKAPATRSTSSRPSRTGCSTGP